MDLSRKHIELRGIVQGVGFRPFVYNRARSLGLSGHVFNTSAGLEVEVEGDPAAVEQFLASLANSGPPLARIAETRVSSQAPRGEIGFTIRESVAEEAQYVLVSPDMATCEDCRAEFLDPRNRRYEYPFTNCTNCGPRYSIVRDIPYDRPNTTMAAFRMCAACQCEYDDPADRRFHAQPNACPVCGPELSAPLAAVRRELAAGGIVALRGLGGFHLACDAANEEAVRRLRQRKRRSDKPFAVMAANLDAVEEICETGELERRLLTGERRPVVILPRREGAPLPAVLAPGNQTLGVMLPYTPLHALLFEGAPYRVLVMTSGNLSEEPIVTANREACERLGGVADSFLLHNRDIQTRVDDSVVRVFENKERVLRRSRGYAPQPIDLAMDVPEILACGGELKNTFCLSKGSYALLSQHLGDLENYETLVFFEETLANLKKLFRVEPRMVAYDLHPGYLSTRFALAVPDLPKVGVQHHHAHIAACMAENRLRGQVIGVAFDGTGFGTDGQIWGGEFLVAGFRDFERRGHFRYVALAGGDAGIRQPWRMALSYLRDAFGDAPPELPALAAVPARHRDAVRSMLSRNFNTVQTSSCGRLFDAVAALAGVRTEVNFEAQAAIELETLSDDGVEQRYGFEIGAGEPWQIDFRPMIREIAADVKACRPAGFIAGRFHNTLAAAVGDGCTRIREAEHLNWVCLSGGSFQNVKLLRRVLAELRGRGFAVFLHAQVPPNDGGLALGQLAVAAAQTAYI